MQYSCTLCLFLFFCFFLFVVVVSADCRWCPRGWLSVCVVSWLVRSLVGRLWGLIEVRYCAE